MKKYYCKEKNIYFNSIKSVCNELSLNYENTKRSFTKNKWKNEFNYKGLTFQIKYEPAVITFLNRQIKEKKELKLKDKEYHLIFKENWKKITLDYPNNKEYQEFLLFYENYLKNESFNLNKLTLKWKIRYETWMCDTETTFTAVLPEKYLFKDEKKGYGNNASETISNLHISKLLDENIKKDGIKEFFKKNPKIKPYMWAWNTYNFKTKEYFLLNYNEAIKFLDEYKHKVLHYYHNLTYDAYYVCSALVNDYSYQIINEPEYKVKKETNWVQPKRTIIIMANDNKILQVKIKNSLNKVITMECTYLKTLASVDKLGQIMNKPKLELNYMLPRSKDHVFTDDEKDYIFRDVDIVVTYLNNVAESFLKRFNKKLIWGLTLGMTSFNMLKDTFGKDKWEKMFIYKICSNNWKKLDKETKLKYDNKIPTVLTPQESIYLRKGIFDIKNNCWSGGFYNGGYTNYNIKYVGIEHKNISSLDIKSSYPDKWEHYKMPYKSPIYNCSCDDFDLSNNSQHFKLYEIEILKDIKILKGKENMIPTKQEGVENNKVWTAIDYFPFMIKGKYLLSQYMVKIFFILFEPDINCFIIKKTMCFKHKIIKELKSYDELWQKEKEIKGLKKTNASYYELCKLFLNGPTGKFGQKEIIDEYQFSTDENGIIYKGTPVKVKEFEDLNKFSYLPIIIATTDLSRLHLLSLIEAVGWDNWHNSDTDSCKFWLPEKFKPEYKPTYLNLINDKIETIYNEPGENIFGKWELEWTTERFKCSGKKKYIYLKNGKIVVVCAGATKSITEKMTFESFFIGFHTLEKDNNKVDKLNGLPVILPTTFQIKNVFLSKNWILMSRKSLLHDYYIDSLDRIEKLINDNKKQINKEIIDFNYDMQDDLNSKIGVFS